jgi:nitroreductase
VQTRALLLPLIAGVLGLNTLIATAQALRPIELPPAQTTGGKPLMQALQDRRTVRELKTNDLPAQLLANVLWAGYGINRTNSGQRTAPSAMNSQEVDIYVALPDGLYLYEAKPHRLTPVLGGDFRTKTSGQPFAKDAPVVLILVADLPRLAKARPEDRSFYAAIDTGCISQNIYLCCASEGLATVVYAVNAAPLAEAMKLRPDQRVMLAQAVGYPKN